MLELPFDSPPSVNLLEYLVPGVLGQKENLRKAVRLWLILRSLYGDLAVEFPDESDSWFSNAQWRDIFLQPDKRTKTLQEWLFEDQMGANELQWRQSFMKRYGMSTDQLDLLLNDASNQVSSYPFEVNNRTLRNDFITLENLGWLKAMGTGTQRRYCKVSQFPDLPCISPTTEITTTHFIPNDLASVVDHFPQPINGTQRFILDVEYIISQSVSQQVDCLLQTLKQIWQQTPVPPVRIIYRSIRYYDTEFDLIIYPVCVYYFQRAPYLFGFGQTPQQISEQHSDSPNWYDYRLDRILSLEALSWDTPSLPRIWFSNSPSPPIRSPDHIPRLFAEKTPNFVEQEVAAALGIEIHRSIEPLLLRFDRYFYGNYIANTERAKLFHEMGFEQAEKYFQANPTVAAQTLSLAHLFRDRLHHQADVFCLTDHRLDDNNVVMRLRAWGPRVEVLLPFCLRQRMKDEVQKTWKLYGEHNE